MRYSAIFRYGAAIGLAVLVFLLRGPIEAWAEVQASPILYLPSVTLAAWYGGLGPGLTATALGGLLWIYFDIPPFESLYVPLPGDQFRVAVFVGEGVLLSVLMERLHAAKRASDRYAVDLEEAQRRALRAERLAAIGQMIAGLAHESRNALQRSQACLEMLTFRLEGRPGELDLAAGIQDAQDDLLRLHEEVRGYAAPMGLDLHETRLRDLLRVAWDQLEGKKRGRVVHLVDCGEGDDRCLVDAPRLVRVFRNVLDNSLAACHDPVEVAVAWSGVDLGGRPAVRVSLRDNGPGLSADQRENLFEPFYTTKTQGMGLGMAIVRRIVEAHGGTIVAGEAAPGTEIVMTLPRGIA